MSVLLAKPNPPWSHLGYEVFSVSSNSMDLPEMAGYKDNPAVLLVHGFGASTDHWRYNIPVLARTHEVHAIDLLGFGRSAKPGELHPHTSACRRPCVLLFRRLRAQRAFSRFWQIRPHFGTDFSQAARPGQVILLL